MRRWPSAHLLRFAFRVALLLAAAAVSLPAQSDSLTVRTHQGAVRGKWIASRHVRAFLGLPYAAPPTGALRWRPPQPPSAWSGLRAATEFGAHCAQLPLYADIAFRSRAASEDCLTLNVYAPAAKPGKGRWPVMFWIHGGNYDAGSASEPRHDGSSLPQKGVVLVTINYRLGVFGFLATSELAREGGGAAGNYGLMDMIAALAWVRDNVAAFGGDPANVTIFGESAGSYAVSQLMASPLARGLFGKAIGESGSAFPQTGATLSQSDILRRGDEWMAAQGISSLAALRALSAERLLRAAKDRVGGMPLYVDGRVLVEPIETSYAQGRQAHIPLLAGWNREEAGASPYNHGLWSWRAEAVVLFREEAERFLELYPGRTDEEARRSSLDYASDRFIAFSAWKWIEAHRETGEAPLYRYRFDLPSPPSKYHAGSYAFHSDEIEYVFGSLATRPGAVWRPEDRRLSETMQLYWTNFARRGDPNGPGLAPWPLYGPANPVLHLDREIQARADEARARYLFLVRHLKP